MRGWKSLTGKLKAAQEQEAEFLRQKRALDDERRELKLQVERQVQQELEEVRRLAQQQVEEQTQLKLQDKDSKIEGLLQKINELQRKAEQGSQQAQGEVLEITGGAATAQPFPDGRDPAGCQGAVRRRPAPYGARRSGPAVRHHPVGVQADAELVSRLAGEATWRSAHCGCGGGGIG